MLPELIDQLLQVLGSAVVPVCLLLIGLSLESYGLKGPVPAAVQLSVVKLVLMPALVLAVAHWAFGLVGAPLSVVVLMAALPVGSNALIFAQRYRTDRPQPPRRWWFRHSSHAIAAPLAGCALAHFLRQKGQSPVRRWRPPTSLNAWLSWAPAHAQPLTVIARAPLAARNAALLEGFARLFTRRRGAAAGKSSSSIHSTTGLRRGTGRSLN